MVAKRMDSIAHGLAGAVIGYSGFRQRGGRAALWASIAGSQFPDSDILLLLVNGETYLQWHRGITHSLLLLPLWSAMVGFLVWEMAGRCHIRLLWAAAAAGMVSHVFLDWITSYGTMLWSPLSDARFALSWVFILDPWVWAILGVALWAAIRTQRPAVARAGVAALCGYVLFCGASQAIALHQAREQYGASRLQAYPQPLNPLGWTVLHQNGDVVQWINRGQVREFRQYRDEELLPKAEATEAVRLFRWFAEVPLVEKLTEQGRTVLRYRDLRFRSPLPWGGVREGLFVVAKVVFDSRGNVLAAGLTSDD